MKALLAAALLASAAGPATAAGGCAPGDAPRVSAFAETGMPEVVRNVDPAWLAGEISVGVGYEPRGATSAHPQRGTQVALVSQPGPDGGWCSMPESVAVTMRYAEPMRIYLSGAMAEGSCPMRVTLAHELRHAAIWDDALRQAAELSREAVGTVARSSLPAWGATAGEAERAAAEAVESAVQRALDVAMAHARARNAAMDTPAAYMADFAGCGGWR